MARETSQQRTEREWREIRATAEEAGYVNPYPEPGQTIVVTIEDRCSACRWTLFVDLQNNVYCTNPKCSERQVVLNATEKEES